MKEIYNISDRKILEELNSFPNQAIINEILSTNKTGRIFQIENNFLIIENSSNPYVFLAGDVNYNDVNIIIEFLKDYNFQMLYCAYKYHHLFLMRNYNFHMRCEFKLKKPSDMNLENESVNVEKIDNMDLFKKCIKYESISLKYGCAENFLKFGLGYALISEGQVVSEVYVNTSRNYGEIDLITNRNYRRKGYAKIINSYVIQELHERNIIPVWSCNIDNHASFLTAINLGFKPVYYYTFLTEDFGNVLCKKLGHFIENNSYNKLYESD